MLSMKILINQFLVILIVSSIPILAISSRGKIQSPYPKENVYLHQNASLLFSGETLLYKVYCFDVQKNQLSKLSKIAYVVLISEEGDCVFSHKLFLEDGIANGDFFVSNSIPTGSYKLIVYTRLMLGKGHYFESDIHILNPYSTIPKKHIANSDSFQKHSSTIYNYGSTGRSAGALLDLELDKKNVGTRQKLILQVKSANDDILEGSYSLSIRRVDDITPPKVPEIQAVFNSNDDKRHQVQDSLNIPLLPELRGELVSGSITSKNGLPVKGQKVALSIPGNDHLLYIGTADENGTFFMNIDRRYKTDKAYVAIVNTKNQEFDIQINTKIQPEFSFSVKPFKVSKNDSVSIKRRSIYNQIELANKNHRPDSLLRVNFEPPFYHVMDKVYILDEYTRFNNVEETIIEVTDNLSIRSTTEGERVFQIRPLEGFTREREIEPLVLVDGVFIKNHEDIIKYNSRKIQSISFSRKKALIGGSVFQGILLFETINNDFLETVAVLKMQKKKLHKPQGEKLYYRQDYSGENYKRYERIPDFRSQLLWVPNITLTGANTEIGFFSSDNIGRYEIVLKGLTKNGKPLVCRKLFTVE